MRRSFLRVQTFFLTCGKKCSRLRVVVLTAFMAPAFSLGGQTAQVLRGIVTSAVSQLPVPGADIVVAGLQQARAVTDSLGRFSATVAPGRYSLIIRHSAYRTVVRDNVLVYSGRQQVQEIELEDFGGDLSTVTVNPARDGHDFELGLFNVQQFAAVFYDPARVAYSHAGVINADDATNQTTVRGTSPNFLQWKLEGVEIVNPNHMENAGTLNDRPAPNGGGVSMISAQLQENSSFLFPPFSAMHGNALSGLYDMRLRRGNGEKREHIVQASLLGTDLATEGPFSSRSGASYLLNLRYSTIGLLSRMGVDFGDERTTFGDFSHVLSFPFSKGVLKVFGMSGTSGTLYSGAADSSRLEIQKQLHDIDYRSVTLIHGASLLNRIGERAYVKTVFAWSKKEASRSAVPAGAAPLEAITENDFLGQEKLSGLAFASARIGRATHLRAGSYLNYFTSEYSSSAGGVQHSNDKLPETVAQPFVNMEVPVTRFFGMEAGLHMMYLPELRYSRIQPRGKLSFLLSAQQQLTLKYGLSDQVQPAMLRLSHAANRRLVPSVCQAFSLAYALLAGSFKLRTEAYYQLYDRLPLAADSGFSAFNFFNENIYALRLSQEGTAEVRGVDLIAERSGRGYYVLASSSLYTSEYHHPSSGSRPGRFSTGYNLFITGGKEFVLKRNRTFGLDARVTSRNGFRQDEPLLPGTYIYDSQLPPYRRADLRISYRVNKSQSSVIWALDVQNVTGHRNVAYRYFDTVTGKVETKYQLGLIPVLSYKVMF